MDKRLRLNVKGIIRFLAVFVILFWMWNFFRSYLLFFMMLLMISGVILSAAGLWTARGRIRAEIVLPCQHVGKNTEMPVEIRFANPLRFVGFSIDVTYRFGNLFTGSTEERTEKLWTAPGKGGSLRFLLNSRYAGRLRVSVEEYRIYDVLHLFYLTDREGKGAETLAWPFFSDGEDAEEAYAHMEGFPKEDESRKRGTEYNPDYEIREYIAGDELKSIHWKLSAKQGKMMVRERLAAGREKVNVLLPLTDRLDENDALMECLYGMCRLLLSKTYPIQLFWQGVGGALCSRYIVETGELENALGEILSINGIRRRGMAEAQMALEYPAEQYILCRQLRQRLDGRPVSVSAAKSKKALPFRKKKEQNEADISLVKIRDNDKYDLLAALASTLLLFALVYGAVGGFLSAFEIKFHAGLCIFALFTLAFLLSAIYETGKRWLINLTALLVFLLYLVIAVTNYWVINSGYYYILNRIFDRARNYLNVSSGMEYSLAVDDGYMAVTVFAIFLGMVGIILLNIQLHNKCTILGVMVLTLTPYVIPMYLENQPALFYTILLLTGYAAVMMLSYGRGRVAVQIRCLLPVTAAAVVLLVRTAAFFLPEDRYARIVPQSGGKEASKQGMEQLARYGMLALFPQDTAGSGVSGGKLSKGSAVMPSYETALIVRYTPYSMQPVYLKAFTGMDYIGTSWTEADMEWPGDGRMEMAVYNRERQFEQTGGASGQGMGVMEVEKAGAGDPFEYRPYYTDYRNIEENNQTFIYHYYPDNQTSVLETRKEPYARYLLVPESCENAVRRICEEAGFSGTEEEVAKQVVSYFDENYDYTLRPGLYYGNPDYISHFLTESKKGYCAHFASAATMLFRQMGIPARYVEGYAFSYTAVVENGELVQGADYDDYYQGFSELGETALIRIEIPEAYAHAWVEIYDSGRGWIVVDPTPSSDENETASFWDVFMNGGGGAERTLGEDVLGGYLENALGAVNYVFFAALFIAVIVFTVITMIRRERARRLPVRERIRLEYGRLQKAAARKNKDFLALRTLKEQIAWMRTNCRVEINDAQEEALYQVFFGKETEYDCELLCRVLRKSVVR